MVRFDFTWAMATALGLFCLSWPAVDATVLSYTLGAGATECFYALVTKSDQKVAVYYAVQSGGDYDLDYHITAPKGEIMMSGFRERNIDLVFTGYDQGEYAFCLENSGSSSYADKTIDFEVLVENDSVQATMPLKHPLDPEKQGNMQESIFRMTALVGQIERAMKYFHTRESRNMDTVESTESRIFWFAVLQSMAIIGMAMAQVWVIRTFFSSKSGGGRL